jgi:Putative zinc- or iron-chelating domain
MNTPTSPVTPAASSSADDAARAFFQALHQAYAQTLATYRDQPAWLEALLSQAFDSFQGNLMAQCEGEPPLACHRGCDSCCTLRVSATAPEVLLVARFLRAVQPRLLARGIDLVGRLRAANARTQGLSEAQRVALRQPCPFVAQGVCVVYSVRPLACRGHASHDVAACRQAAAGDVAQVPYSQGHWMVRSLVQNALQSALRDSGRAWVSYELNQALCLALDDEQAEAAWLAGADPLASAALPEAMAEAVAMAQAFDTLKAQPAQC